MRTLSLARILTLSAALVGTLQAQRIVYEDTFSGVVNVDKNRYGSDNGNFAYRISYTDATSLLNTVHNPYSGVNAMAGVTGAMKVSASGGNSTTTGDNVVQVSAFFDRTTISVGQSIAFDADVQVFAKSHIVTGADLGINNMLRFGLVNIPNASAAWKRATPPADATVVYEGVGNATFVGTGFMSNFQTGLLGTDATVSRLSPLSRNGTDNRLANNTGGWTALAAGSYVESTFADNLIQDSYANGVAMHLNQSIERLTTSTFRVNSNVTSDAWNGVFLSYSYDYDAGAAGDSWAQFDTMFFTINSGGNGIYTSLWDNFRVSVVPEPSKAVLAFAGLFLVGFRRQRSM